MSRAPGLYLARTALGRAVTRSGMQYDPTTEQLPSLPGKKLAPLQWCAVLLHDWSQVHKIIMQHHVCRSSRCVALHPCSLLCKR